MNREELHSIIADGQPNICQIVAIKDEEKVYSDTWNNYKENPDRIPKYIYVDYEENHNNSSVRILNKMFDYTREKLSNGILLTVKNVKFEV